MGALHQQHQQGMLSMEAGASMAVVQALAAAVVVVTGGMGKHHAPAQPTWSGQGVMGTVMAGQGVMKGPAGQGQGVPEPHPPPHDLTQLLLGDQALAGLIPQSMCARGSRRSQRGG